MGTTLNTVKFSTTFILPSPFESTLNPKESYPPSHQYQCGSSYPSNALDSLQPCREQQPGHQIGWVPTTGGFSVLTYTPGEPLQRDPGRGTHYTEADWHRQMEPVIRGSSIRGYCLTRYQGDFQPHTRGPPPCGRKRVALTRDVHQALADFILLAEDLVRFPSRLYELVTLQPTLDGYHKASGYLCGGRVLLEPTVVLRTPQQNPSAAATPLNPVGAHPIL